MRRRSADEARDGRSAQRLALTGLARHWWRSVLPVAQAMVMRQVSFHGFHIDIPLRPMLRLSLMAGNVRVQRLIDASVGPGDRAVDVGAHIGLNTLYLAARVGPAGRVTAIEPAPDNLNVLRRNLAANHFSAVKVCGVAAGRAHERREFFLRGEVSAVNSLFAESFYASVSGVADVIVAPLDDLVDEMPRLVKIDVEGAELDVIGGMTRLMRGPGIRLIVEWHPVLQESAGYSADALPRALWDRGFTLYAASHTRVARFTQTDLPALIARLRRDRRPIELLAQR